MRGAIQSLNQSGRGQMDSKKNNTPLPARPENTQDENEESLDKTIADSFPASDPPSSIPDPDESEDAA